MLAPRERDRDQRRPPRRAAGRIDPRVGPERRADDLHRRRSRRRPRASPACGSRRCPIQPAARRSGPRRLRPLPRHRPGRVDRAARRRPGRPTARRSTIATMQVDDAAAAFEPMDLLTGARVGGDAQARRVGHQRAARDDAPAAPRGAEGGAPFGFPGGTRVTLRIAQEDGSIGQGVGRFRLAATAAADPLIGATVPAALRPLVLRDRAPTVPPTAPRTSRRTSARRRRRSKPTRDALNAARKALVDLQLPSTLVMQDRPGFERPSYELRERGAFMSRGERVYARTPLALPPMKDSLPANRLGLARWLVDRDNPLVARVPSTACGSSSSAAASSRPARTSARRASRRRTRSCSTGSPSSSMDRGWSQKTLLRTIVTSATYRQASAVSPALAERDPVQPPVRARAALPPRSRDDPRRRARRERAAQPEDAAARASSRRSPRASGTCPTTRIEWVESEGEDRYRRSLYTFLRRTSPYPMHHDVRRHQPRVLHGAARAHQHAAAGADAAERSRLVRGGAGAGGAGRRASPDAARRGRRYAFRLVVARDAEAGRARADRSPTSTPSGRSSRGGRRGARAVAPSPAARASPPPTPRRGRSPPTCC